MRKRASNLALVAVVILGVSGLAIAQEGYYGQQAAPRPAATQSRPATACLGARVFLVAGTTVAETPGCVDAANQKSEQKKVEKGKSIAAPTAPEGDPAAPQNRIEYGGGGM